MQTLLRQNINKRTADVIGVAFAVVGDAGLEGVFQRAGGGNRSHGARVGCVLNVGGRQGVSATGSRGDSDGVVGGDADIHALNVTPLWRICKQPMHVVM